MSAGVATHGLFRGILPSPVSARGAPLVAFPVQGLRWTEGSTANTVSITGGSVASGGTVPFIELLNIAASPAQYPTDLTATFVMAGNPN